MFNGNIEFVNGQESHTSYWGKFYVKGLETWEVKEDFAENCHDKHHSYQGYVCLDVPEGTMFSIFEQNGNKRGTDDYIFRICQVTEDVTTIDSIYGSGKITGNFKVVATSGNSKTKAPRLFAWWKDSADHSYEFACACAAHIDKRGQKNPPVLCTQS